MHGPTCIVWADLTPSSLQRLEEQRRAAQLQLLRQRQEKLQQQQQHRQARLADLQQAPKLILKARHAEEGSPNASPSAAAGLSGGSLSGGRCVR